MNNNILMIMLALLLVLPITTAEVQTLGTFKQGTTVTLLQFCDNSTYSNVSSIIRPDAVFIVSEDNVMTKDGNKYTLTVTDTNILGTYSVYGHCDEEGTDTAWGYTFEISSENREGNILAYTLVWILSFALLIGFYISTRKIPLYRLTTAILLMLNTFVGFYFMNSPIASFISFIGIIFMFKETIYFMNNLID